MSTNTSHPSSTVTGLKLFLPRQVLCFEFKHFAHGCSAFAGGGRSPAKQEQLPTCCGWHQPRWRKSPLPRWQPPVRRYPHRHCTPSNPIAPVNLSGLFNKTVCKGGCWAMPDTHVPVCSMPAPLLGSSHYKPASNYILTFCFYHSELRQGQNREELGNTHGSNHKHFLTFTRFCNTKKTDMLS